jgi:dipeptidyl-peptidase 4
MIVRNSRLSRHAWLVRSLLILWGCSTISLTPPSAPANDQTEPLAELRTVAEKSDYQDFATYEQLTEFCRELARQSTQVRHFSLGSSAEGRSIPALIVESQSADSRVRENAALDETSPDTRKANPSTRISEEFPPRLLDALQRPPEDHRLWILLIAGVHGDECEGTESLLALLRDLSHSPAPPWLDDLVLVAVPRWNVDGAERRGPRHRPQASVPAEVGRRVNAQEIDLDQDLLALRAPESRQLVQLLTLSRPDLMIALRTSADRSRESALRLVAASHPATPDPLKTWFNETAAVQLEQVIDARSPHPAARSPHPAARSPHPAPPSPRHLAEYAAVRGTAAFTSEVTLGVPYADRIRAGTQFLDNALTWSSRQRAELREIRAATDNQVTQAGARPAVGDVLPLAVTWKEANGEDKPRAELQIIRDVPRPFAYLLPRQQSRLADRLLMHGFRLSEVQQSVTIPVESYQVTKLSRLELTDEQRALTGSLEGQLWCEVEREARDELIEQGTYALTLDQPLGNLAPLLLEPQSEVGWLADGLWQGYVARAGDRYPVLRINSPPEAWSLGEVESIVPAEQLTLDLIYGPERKQSFGPSLPTVHWLPNENSYLRRLEDRWMQISAATGAVQPWYEPSSVADALIRSALLPENVAREISADLGRFASRQLSPQNDAVVFSHAQDLYYTRLDGTEARRLTRSPAEEQYPTFSPDGKRVAFVRDHNLLVVDVDSGLERQLTTEGNENQLYGELDWVYQEEIYGRGEFRGFWWSPDSRRLALLVLDQTSVHRHAIADHLAVEQTLSITPYPKAGASLPSARLAIVEAAGGELVWVDLPRSGAEELLIVRVDWTPNSEEVTYQVQGREQNWLELLRADPVSGQSRRLLRDESEAWIDVLDNPYWLDDGSFLWLSQRDGHARLYRCGGPIEKETPLTPSSLEIRQLHGVDPSGQHMYFTGLESESLAEQVYEVDLEKSSTKPVSSKEGFHAARFSHDMAFFLDTHSTVHQTPSMQVRGADGAVRHHIVPRQDDDLRYFELAEPEFHRVRARDGTLLEGMLIRPKNLDARQRYPVLCYVYGGPQAPTVRDRWGATNYLWHQMLAQQGVCVWLCDNRASSQRGVGSAWPIHGRLGEIELRDIEDGVRWLQQQPWCDPERIGIWGWSYGGYLTSYALTHSQLFRAGISGAPVTDWHNYDAIYTERLMRMPQNNVEGYQASSAVQAADKLHGRLLLVHGDADDNVHLGNTLQLADALQKAGKRFDLMIYPRSLHGVTQPERLRHLREVMTDFVHQRLAGE